MSSQFDFQSRPRRPGRLGPAVAYRARASFASRCRAGLLQGWALAFSRDGAAGLALTLVLAGALIWGWRLQSADQAGAERERLQMAVNLAASVMQADLSRSLAAADTLEAMLRHDGTVEPFEMAVAELRERFPLIHTVTLAPGGVVRQVSPSELAATFTGLRLLEVPASRAEARQALRSRSMVVGVANDDKQGAYITGYQPVYRRSAGVAGAAGAAETAHSGALWGLVTISLRLPRLDDYLSAARLTPAEWLAELNYFDTQSPGWVRLTDARIGDSAPVVTAQVQLPGRTLSLRIAAHPNWQGFNAWPGVMAAVCVLAGITCTLVLNRRRRLAVRRQFFESSQILAGWTEEFDAAHARLDVLRHTRGLAVVAVVRMPTVGTFQRQGAPVQAGEQRDWSNLILGLQRGGDLLLPLHGCDFLLAAHSLPTQELAVRVRRRLQSQLEDLSKMACGAETLPLFFEALVFDPEERDPGAVLARLLVALHSEEPKPRRARAGAPAGLSPT